jgi:mono/diheme cytochrome c family protein
MAWWLDCHRHPENALRPLDQITNLDWVPAVKPGQTPAEAQVAQGLELKKAWNINPPDGNCAGCHR